MTTVPTSSKYTSVDGEFGEACAQTALLFLAIIDFGAPLIASPPPDARRHLSVQLKVALDVVRSLAALLVVFQHVGGEKVPQLGLLSRFGQEAVMVFFLLSGFLIFANEERRAHDLSGYFLRRVRRILPLMLIAFMVSVLVSWTAGTLSAEFSWAELAGNLMALQDVASLKPGVIVQPFLGNDPLWSLSYEIAFYIIFPFLLPAWRMAPRGTTLAVGLLCCGCYAVYVIQPNHLALVGAYFLLWWSGAMVAEAYLAGFRSCRHLPLVMGSLALLLIISVVDLIVRGFTGLGLYPFLMVRHFLVVILLIIIGFSPLGRWIVQSLLPFARPGAVFSSISYGIYVLHYPLMIKSPLSESILGFLGMTVLTFALAWLFDRKLNEVMPKPKPGQLQIKASAKLV